MDEYELRRHIAAVVRAEGRHGFRAQLGALDDSGDIQTVTTPGYAGEELAQVMRVQPHGFASNPPIGSHGLILPLGGERILGAAFGFEHQDHRQKNLPSGASVLYDDKGNVVSLFGRDGIQIEAASGDIYVKPAKGKNLYLGGKPGDGSQFAPVKTSAGDSTNVFAKYG